MLFLVVLNKKENIVLFLFPSLLFSIIIYFSFGKHSIFVLTGQKNHRFCYFPIVKLKSVFELKRIATCIIFLSLSIQNKAAILDEVYSSINDFLKNSFFFIRFLFEF